MPTYLPVEHHRGGPDAGPVTADGPQDVSSEPGSRGDPPYEWIDVRQVMAGAPSTDGPR